MWQKETKRERERALASYNREKLNIHLNNNATVFNNPISLLSNVVAK